MKTIELTEEQIGTLRRLLREEAKRNGWHEWTYEGVPQYRLPAILRRLGKIDKKLIEARYR